MIKRDYYTYEFRVGNATVHSGITRDPKRREQEHKQRWDTGRLVIVGRAKTEEAARKWAATRQDPFTPPCKPK
jgi:predicted GIY-YIG superfamily endonuclease